MPEDAVKQEEGAEASKPASTASRSDSARSPSPSSGTRSPVLPSPDKRNGKTASTRRSETPDVALGHGHQMLAQRAISPVRSRAGTPIGRSRSRDRDTGSKLGGASGSSSGSKKRKDPREHNTAPADSPARELAPASSKKHRANTDHGTSSGLSPENRAYLPSPTPYDRNEPVHREAPGPGPSKHKARGKKKQDSPPTDALQDFAGAIPIAAIKDFLRSGPKSDSDIITHFRVQASQYPLNRQRLRLLTEKYTTKEGSLRKLKPT